jgi:erythromycin esterase
MKNRIIQYLAANNGFDIFSIEGNMPEAYRVSDYAVRGEGDPKKLIAGMYFWTWRTEEVLNMVEWMRKFNQPKQRIEFTGFDMQYYLGAINELFDAYKGNNEIEKKITDKKET